MGKLKNKVLLGACLQILVFSSYLYSQQNLLLLRAEGEDFVEAKNSISYDLEYDFEIHDKVIDAETSVDDVKEIMNSVKPDVVILMNNTTISLYKEYQESLGALDSYVPSVSLMGILIGDAIDGLKNAYGVEYEIPIVTSSVKLRSLMADHDISKIGIVHQASFAQFISENKVYCDAEGIELHTVEITGERAERQLKNALEDLVEEQNVDAIWVPLDNVIVNNGSLSGVWIPFQKENEMPVIVGVKVLASPQFHFGTFAVIPDHNGLGSQAASVVFDIMDNDWVVPENGGTQPPLSVRTVVNLPDNIDYFDIEEDELSGVDEILK